jgi:hypothetical protein
VSLIEAMCACVSDRTAIDFTTAEATGPAVQPSLLPLPGAVPSAGMVAGLGMPRPVVKVVEGKKRPARSKWDQGEPAAPGGKQSGSAAPTAAAATTTTGSRYAEYAYASPPPTSCTLLSTVSHRVHITRSAHVKEDTRRACTGWPRRQRSRHGSGKSDLRSTITTIPLLLLHCLERSLSLSRIYLSRLPCVVVVVVVGGWRAGRRAHATAPPNQPHIPTTHKHEEWNFRQEVPTPSSFTRVPCCVGRCLFYCCAANRAAPGRKE